VAIPEIRTWLDIPLRWRNSVCTCADFPYEGQIYGLFGIDEHHPQAVCKFCEKPGAYYLYICPRCGEIFMYDFVHPGHWEVHNEKGEFHCWDCLEEEYPDLEFPPIPKILENHPNAMKQEIKRAPLHLTAKQYRELDNQPSAFSF
jgi:DNA-directed RNA polymerase subunit RPC12/RpoP